MRTIRTIWGTVAAFAVTPTQATTVKQNIPGPPALNSQAYALAQP